MKRSVYIIVGIIFILVLLAIWIYVMFFNKPTADPDIYTELEVTGGTDSEPVTEPDPVTADPLVDVAGQEKLRQLTTKPTIGHQEITGDASTTPKVFWIESGTGHIFSIDLKTGEESRVSATTIPSARKGAITPDGNHFLIQSGNGSKRELVIGTIDQLSNTVTIQEIGGNVIDFKSTTDNTFLFAIQTDSSVIVKQYLPIENSSENLFTIPFREVTIDWGESESDIHFVFPKSTNMLEGFLYQVENNTLTRLPIAGKGMSAQGNKSLVIYSKQGDDGYTSFIYNQETRETKPSNITFVPEKCLQLHLSTSNIFCAQTITTYGNSLPDSWYQGQIIFNDLFWDLDTELESATLTLDPQKESGRQLDVTKMVSDPTDSRVYFINKNDQTLWLYTINPFISETTI